MKRCHIFCAGECTQPVTTIEKDDCLLAADGGLAHIEKLGLTPDEILGDFDSLGYVPEGAAVFPVEKDDTDAMLAVRRGLSLGCREFFLYGALDGPRLDHTLANLQTLHFLAQEGAVGYLVGKTYIATVLREEKLYFPETFRGIVSLFCVGAEATGVSISGLKYNMEKGGLRPEFPLGVSNSFVGTEACVEVTKGSVLVLYDKENGLPPMREVAR